MINFEQQICVSFANIDYSFIKKEINSIYRAELRLDLLELSNNEIKEICSSHKRIIATFRYTQSKHEVYLNTLKNAIISGAEYIDIDINTPENIKNELISFAHSFPTKLIISYHNYKDIPDTASLLNIIDEAFDLGADIVKIACMAQQYTDCIRILSLNQTNRPIIALAMGEKGISSRLLAIQLGSPFTFAYHDKATPTANGQLSYSEMISTLKILSKKNPSYYGVIGNPILHSLSPSIFEAGLKQNNINGYYLRILAISANDLKLLFAHGFQGFNITSPFKNNIKSIFDTKTNKEAVNCIIKTDTNYISHNTDTNGVIDTLKMHQIDVSEKNILVIGAGGAAYSVIESLKHFDTKIYITNRTYSKAVELSDKFSANHISFEQITKIIDKIEIIINTISYAIPQILVKLLHKNTIIFDADYRLAPYFDYSQKQNCKYLSGKDWLINQAIPSFSLLTGKSIDYETAKKAIQKPILHSKNRIMLIGLMNVGKTTIGKELAKLLKYKHIDIDKEIEKKQGISITQIFEKYGEEYFRKIESDILNQTIKQENVVISSGGGIVCKETNRNLIKSSCFAIWLFASPNTLSKRDNANKPLLKHGNQELIYQKLLQKRMSHYAECADIMTITENKSISETTNLLFNEIQLI